MKEKIIQCKKENPAWGYYKIAKYLGCSKNIVKYHLDPLAREKSLNRTKINKKRLNGILKTKKDNFQSSGSWIKGKNYRRRNRISSIFTAKQLKEKLFNNQICYLSGEKIDLNSPKTYSLDHIIPVSKGGNNSLENCGLVTRNVNMSKSDMTVNEYLELCKKVLEFNGYKVEKNGG